MVAIAEELGGFGYTGILLTLLASVAAAVYVPRFILIQSSTQLHPIPQNLHAILTPYHPTLTQFSFTTIYTHATPHNPHTALTFV